MSDFQTLLHWTKMHIWEKPLFSYCLHFDDWLFVTLKNLTQILRNFATSIFLKLMNFAPNFPTVFTTQQNLERIHKSTLKPYFDGKKESFWSHMRKIVKKAWMALRHTIRKVKFLSKKFNFDKKTQQFHEFFTQIFFD